MLELDRLVITQDDFRLTADFAVPKGARVAVVGPSGAGKSTLLSVISGFFPPESGRILWDSQDITDAPPGARPLSILFQDQNLFPHLTVAQNVGLGLRPDLRLTAEDRERVAGALARTGLQGLGDRRPGTLSGGQQSRVALARVLLRARPLMLLDEPFAALGPALKADMLDLVAEIADETGATVLMVSHDPDDALSFSGQTVLVAAGVAHAPRPTAALFADPPPELAAYLGRPGPH
ncbi:ATP-binding cassette domain-containing protein [Albidovulum sp.]|uniref:thiamine ABC transporter ATP-binding protein n=1 Tax=Albidovulum sp. TaxID=1872424 RepID=UPI0039B92324